MMDWGSGVIAVLVGFVSLFVTIFWMAIGLRALKVLERLSSTVERYLVSRHDEGRSRPS
jgi:uncharacterized membrane protein YuzA (DUF378 family)